MENTLKDLISATRYKVNPDIPFDLLLRVFLNPTEFIHNKTGNIYVTSGFAVDATNERSGNLCVKYIRSQLIGTVDNLIYVRDLNEFFEKFTLKQ